MLRAARLSFLVGTLRAAIVNGAQLSHPDGGFAFDFDFAVARGETVQRPRGGDARGPCAAVRCAIVDAARDDDAALLRSGGEMLAWADQLIAMGETASLIRAGTVAHHRDYYRYIVCDSFSHIFFLFHLSLSTTAERILRTLIGRHIAAGERENVATARSTLAGAFIYVPGHVARILLTI